MPDSALSGWDLAPDTRDVAPEEPAFVEQVREACEHLSRAIEVLSGTAADLARMEREAAA